MHHNYFIMVAMHVYNAAMFYIRPYQRRKKNVTASCAIIFVNKLPYIKKLLISLNVIPG